jgi:hypothetical protein
MSGPPRSSPRRGSGSPPPVERSPRPISSRPRSESGSSSSDEHLSEDEVRITDMSRSRPGTKTTAVSSTTNKPAPSVFSGATPRRNQGPSAQPAHSLLSPRTAPTPSLFGKVKRSGGTDPLLTDDVQWMTLDVLQDTPKSVKFEGVLKWTPNVDKSTITTDPIVCSLKINDRETVLKVNNPDAKLHVLNSGFLSKLRLPGTVVPNVQLVTPQRCTDLIRGLPPEDGSGLIAGLTAGLQRTDFPAQLSELVKGVDVSKLNLTAIQREQDTLTGFVKSGRPKAFKAIINSLTKLRSVDQTEWDRNKATATKLAKAVKKTGPVPEELMTAIKFLTSNSKSDDQSQKLLAGLDALATDTVKNRLGELDALNGPTLAWGTYLQNPKNAAVLAAVGAADFILGMDDRLIGKFNGANFMFDADRQSILLVDNGKNVSGERGLIGNEPIKGQIDLNHVNDNKSWNQWRTDQEHITNLDQIADVLFRNIYEAPEIAPLLPPSFNLDIHKAAMKAAVSDTLEKFRTLAFKTDPGKALGLPGLTEALQGRLQALNIQPLNIQPLTLASSRAAVTSSTPSNASTSLNSLQPQPQLPAPTLGGVLAAPSIARPALKRVQRFVGTPSITPPQSDPMPVAITVPSSLHPSPPSSPTLSAPSDIQPQLLPSGRNADEKVPIRRLAPSIQPQMRLRRLNQRPSPRPMGIGAPTVDTPTLSIASTSTATMASNASLLTTPDPSPLTPTSSNTGGQSGTGSQDNVPTSDGGSNDDASL